MKTSTLSVFFFVILCMSTQSCQQENMTESSLEAFWALDLSIRENNNSLTHTNAWKTDQLERNSKLKPAFNSLILRYKNVRDVGSRLSEYIERQRQNIIEESGGFDTQKEEVPHYLRWKQKPKHLEDLKSATQIFIQGSKHYPAQGKVLADKIQQYKKQYVELFAKVWEDKYIPNSVFPDVPNKDSLLNILESKVQITDLTKSPSGTDWLNYRFANKPLAVALPILSQLEQDILRSEKALLDFILPRTEGVSIRYDSLDVIAYSTNARVQLGETYEAQIRIGTYSTQVQYEAWVDGKQLEIKEGKALFKTIPTKTGEQWYEVRVTVRNPITKVEETVSKSFSYNVSPKR